MEKESPPVPSVPWGRFGVFGGGCLALWVFGGGRLGLVLLGLVFFLLWGSFQGRKESCW